MSGEVAAACCCGQGPGPYATSCPEPPTTRPQTLTVTIRALPRSYCGVSSYSNTTWGLCSGSTRSIICYPAIGPVVTGGSSARSVPTWQRGFVQPTAAFMNFTAFNGDAASPCNDYRDLSYSYVQSYGTEETVTVTATDLCTTSGGGAKSFTGAYISGSVSWACCDFCDCDPQYVCSSVTVTVAGTWSSSSSYAYELQYPESPNTCTNPDGAWVYSRWATASWTNNQSTTVKLTRNILASQNTRKMVPGTYTYMVSGYTANDWGAIAYPAGTIIDMDEYGNPCYDGSYQYEQNFSCADISAVSSAGWIITVTVSD